VTFKSPAQPLCRYCGAPIGKKTRSVFVHPRGEENDRPYFCGVLSVDPENPPRSKADCQRLVNQTVVSVRYDDIWWRRDENGSLSADRSFGRVVNSFATWDGESYEDQFFCSDKHAKMFGYASARSNHVTNAYNAALSKNREGK